MSPNIRTAVVYGVTPVWVSALSDLAHTNGLDVVGATDKSELVLRLLDKHKPDLLVIEAPSGDDGDLSEIVHRIRLADQEVKLLVIGDGDGRDHIADAFAAGANVYVFKNADPDDVAAAMRQAFAQSFYVASAWIVPAQSANSNGSLNGHKVSLTRREFEVLQLVSEGHTNVAMASMLWVTEQTVKFHLSNLYRKLEVANRTEAARWARENGASMPPVEEGGG